MEGAAVGALFGGQRGIWPGVAVGYIYGMVAGTGILAAQRLAKKTPRARRLVVGAALAGIVLISVSALALAQRVDRDEFSSIHAVVFGLPIVLCVLAACVWQTRAAKSSAAAPRRAPGTLVLGDPGGHQLLWHVRFIWSWVLLQVIQEKAREVRLEPQGAAWRLCYQAGDVVADFVPIPNFMAAAIVADLKRLAVLPGNGSPPVRLLRRLGCLSPGPPRQGGFHLRVGGTLLDATVSLWPMKWGEAVTLSLPDHNLEADQIEPVLRALGQQAQRVPETGIRHVCQRQGCCGIASVAMIGGVSYAQVQASRARPDAPGMRWGEMLTLLERFTGEKWRSVALGSLPRRLDRIGFPDWPVVVLIHPPWRFWLGHWIVVKGPFVHDPASEGAAPLDECDKRHWRVLAVFQPVRPGRAAGVIVPRL
jgi:hypothetical protein